MPHCTQEVAFYPFGCENCAPETTDPEPAVCQLKFANAEEDPLNPDPHLSTQIARKGELSGARGSRPRRLAAGRLCQIAKAGFARSLELAAEYQSKGPVAKARSSVCSKGSPAAPAGDGQSVPMRSQKHTNLMA